MSNDFEVLSYLHVNVSPGLYIMEYFDSVECSMWPNVENSACAASSLSYAACQWHVQGDFWLVEGCEIKTVWCQLLGDFVPAPWQWVFVVSWLTIFPSSRPWVLLVFFFSSSRNGSLYDTVALRDYSLAWGYRVLIQELWVKIRGIRPKVDDSRGK